MDIQPKICQSLGTMTPDEFTDVRKRLGKSKTEMAATGGISVPSVDKFEQGTLKNPQVRVVNGLALAYGVTPEDVMGACVYTSHDAATADTRSPDGAPVRASA